MATTGIKEQRIRRVDGYQANSLSAFKRMTKTEALISLTDIGVCMSELKTRPWKHQLQSLACMLNTNSCMLSALAGSGKTYTAIMAWYLQRTLKRPVGDMLIVVPNSGVGASWQQEAQERVGIKTIMLDAAGNKKLEQMRGSAKIYCITYSGLQYLIKDNTGRAKRYKVDDNIADSLMKKIGTLILDEAHMARNTTSNSFKAICALRARVNFCYSLTATPFTKLEDAYGSIFPLDGGASLGATKDIFLSKWFNLRRQHWGGVEFRPKKDADAEIKTRFDTIALSYTSDDIENNLPELVQTTVELQPTSEWKRKAADIKKGTITVDGKIKHIVNKGQTLFSLCGDTVSIVDEYTGEKCTESVKSSKCSWVVDFINGLPANEPVVIFTEHIATDALIFDALRKAKIKGAKCYREGDPATNYKDFLSNKIRILIGNSRAIGTGLNLQKSGCRYGINYEHTLSATTLIQRDKRLHRSGAINTVFIYSLIYNGGIEPKIILTTAGGKTFTEAMLATEAVKISR